MSVNLVVRLMCLLVVMACSSGDLHLRVTSTSDLINQTLPAKLPLANVWRGVGSDYFYGYICKLNHQCVIQETISSITSFYQVWPLSETTFVPYGPISRNLAAARYMFRVIRSCWNLTSVSTAVLSRRLSDSGWYGNFDAQSRCYVTLRDFIILGLMA